MWTKGGLLRGAEGTKIQGPPKNAQEALKGVIEACGPRGGCWRGAEHEGELLRGSEGTNNQGPPKKAQEALKGVIEACGPTGGLLEGR